MKISIEAFAMKCIVTKKGFNQGFLVGENAVKSEVNAIHAVKQLGFCSLQAAIEDGVCMRVSFHDLNDMEYVSVNGGPLIKLDQFHIDRKWLNKALAELIYFQPGEVAA